MRAQRSRPVTAVLAVATTLLAASACGPGQRTESGLTVKNGQARLYGTDGTMSNSFGNVLDDQPGVLAGMKGTTPLNPLTDDFKRRMRAVDPNLSDFTYSAEAYDAVVIAALAAETARSTDGRTIARYVNAVTVGGTRCESIKACLDLIRAGRDIHYRGAALRRSGFTDAGEPSTTMYGALNFGRDNRIDAGKTEYVGAGDESAETRAAPPISPPVRLGGRPIGPLKIGGLLPHTGALAYQGPPITAGVQLAIKEINDAGGALGTAVEYLDGDDGTSSDVAAATLDRLISQGVHVVVGPCCSGISLKVLPKAVERGLVMISMSATSDALTTADDKGLYFRTSPPDKLQAKALADIIMRDGASKVFIVARDDAYGVGLQQAVQADLTAAGFKRENIRTATYKVQDAYNPAVDLPQMFNPIGRTAQQFAPDAVLIVGFEESALMIKALQANGVTFRT